MKHSFVITIPLVLLSVLHPVDLLAQQPRNEFHRSTDAADLSPAERELIRQLGSGTPVPMPLWPDKPPQFLENAAPEVIAENQTIKSVSVPTLTPYLPPTDKRNGIAVVVCAGGGYGGHAWKTHVVYAADVFNPMGIAVIGLKYRTRPPHRLPNATSA